MKLTVIVPIYNVEQYLPQCLDSLAAQTAENLQVILVNDGSTDRSGEIAQRYVDRDPGMFHLCHKDNGGLSDARNFAIPFVRSEYLTFLDSDDWVEPEYYEKAIELMDREECDICLADIEYWYKDPEKRFVMKGLSSWKADTIQKKALLSPLFAWNKIYRSELFTEDPMMRFPLRTWYEDIPVTTRLLASAEKIGYLPGAMIHYRQREGSIMASTSDPRLAQIFTVLSSMRDHFETLGIDQKYYDELEYLHAEHLRLYGMFRFIRSDREVEYYEESESVMNSCYPNWKQNHYLKNLSRKNQIFLRWYSCATRWIFDPIIKRK